MESSELFDYVVRPWNIAVICKCLGWYRREGRRTGNHTNMHNWRTLVHQAGLHPDNVEIYARNRGRIRLR